METLKDKITVMTDYPQIISQDIKNIYTIHKLPLKKYSSYDCGYIMQDGTLISCEPYNNVFKCNYPLKTSSKELKNN